MTLQKLKTETAIRKSAKPQHSKQSRAQRRKWQVRTAENLNACCLSRPLIVVCYVLIFQVEIFYKLP